MSFTRRAAHIRQTQEHHCSCTQHQYTLEHHPIYSMDWTIEAEDQGKVEQSLTRRRRQATRSWPRRRRAGKPGHDQGGEGQAIRVVITASRTSSNSKPFSRPHHPYLNHRWISLQIIPASIANICLHAWMDWESISLRLAKWSFAQYITGSSFTKPKCLNQIIASVWHFTGRLSLARVGLAHELVVLGTYPIGYAPQSHNKIHITNKPQHSG
jgi:hypothetical protein